MAESTVPVDLWNPGQVFACLGILETTDVLIGGALGAFDWNSAWKTTFRVSAAGTEPPVAQVMRFLEDARVETRAPEGSRNPDGWKESWGDAPESNDPRKPFPFPDPNSPATLPVVLRDDAGSEVAIDYWGDATRRDNLKFWAGSGGYPGAAIVRDAINIVRGQLRQHANDPFALAGAQSNSLRFDWRRDYIPSHDGFSPNRHKKNIQMVGFPLVEILAAIGVTHARPNRKAKLEYRYGVLGYDEGLLVDPIFHRAALGAERAPIPGRSFRRFIMRLDWPSKEGQARCITQVMEEEDIQ